MPKYREILQNPFRLSRNFARLLLSRNEFSRKFPEILQMLLHEISRNYLENFAKLRNKNFAKFRFLIFS